jgi:hypothetical protein
VSVSGADDLERWLGEYERKLRANVRREITKTALKVNARVKRAILQGPKTGRVHTRAPGQNLSRTHQSSAAGEAPANDTGTLASSIYYSRPSPDTAQIGSRLYYAYELEFGRQGLQPRPSWRPATDAERGPFEDAIREAMRRAAE